MHFKKSSFVILFTLFFTLILNAQWAAGPTFDIGVNYGNIALSQSILSGVSDDNTRIKSNSNNEFSRKMFKEKIFKYLYKVSVSKDTYKKALNSKKVGKDSWVEFKSSATLSKKIKDGIVKGFGNSENLSKFKSEFQKADIINSFNSQLEKHNLSGNNLLDVVTGYTLILTELSKNINITKDQVAAVNKQIKSYLNGKYSGNYIKDLNDADKQLIAESLIYEVVVIQIFKQVLEKNDKYKGKIRELSAEILDDKGFNIKRLSLTNSGYAYNF